MYAGVSLCVSFVHACMHACVRVRVTGDDGDVDYVYVNAQG